MCVRNLFLYCTLISVSIYELKFVSSLQITNLLVPEQATYEAVLECKYSLNFNETLYDVKWYKDGSEFFRCKPDGRHLQFAIDGVKIMKKSELVKDGVCSLILTELNNTTTGDFECEISLEQPFYSKSKVSHLEFVNSTSVQNESLKLSKDAEFIGFVTKINNEAHTNKPKFTLMLNILILVANICIKN